MFYSNEQALTYDDVLIVPNYSEVVPSDTVLKTKFSRNIDLEIPIVSSAMDTVTESSMAIEVAKLGGIGVIHKNLSIEQQVSKVQKVKDLSLKVAAAIGVSEQEFIRAQKLIEAGVDAIVVDTAHGHSKGVLLMVQRIKEDFPQVDVVAGNVATKEACRDLIERGVDAIKIGIGPGSICTTRIVAGVGFPQLQAIINCESICSEHFIPCIADGGVKHSGDIVKALAVGASSVMLGSLLAGTDEAPGEKTSFEGKVYKDYRGMGSLGAMVLGSKDRYGQECVGNQKLVPEGIEGRVIYRGSVSENIHQLVGGIRSGMGYVGAQTLKELNYKARFIRISTSGLKESHPHNIEITKMAPNYRS
jgi:IMP dehydrogenase